MFSLQEVVLIQVRPFKYQHLKSDNEKKSQKIGLRSFRLKFGDTIIQIYTHTHG